MDNSKFSTLLYRIIGKPESWQDEYVDIVNKIVDETESFDDPENYSELAVGDQILSRMQDTNEALSAFNTLLDKSRFKLIILDSNFKPIYHNQNAKELHNRLTNSDNEPALDHRLLSALREAQQTANHVKAQASNSGLMAIDFTLPDSKSSRDKSVSKKSITERLVSANGDVAKNEQIYLRPIIDDSAQVQFNVLLMLDQSRQQSALNSDLIARYELTDKEQMVLINLIHGKSIKTISSESFVSENTVKTHLKSLFRKTNTKSQTDLVGLVLTHESQILDSYFDTTSSPTISPEERAKDKRIILDDGSEITYREYGPRDGYPVIVFHNGYGCRTSIPPDYESICRRRKRRIIIPDRPGFGQTPFIADHPQHWPTQMNEFIAKLNIGDYDVLGTILGCPLAIDFVVQADRHLKHLILSSPVFINTKKDAKYMRGVLAPSARLVRASERFASQSYQLWLKSISLNLGSHYRDMANASLGTAERAQFTAQNNLNEILDIIVSTFREAYSNTLDGITSEMLFGLSPRKLDLSKVEVPVTLWWGSEDNRISHEGVQNLASQFKNSTVHIKEGYSEHIYFALFEDMLA